MCLELVAIAHDHEVDKPHRVALKRHGAEPRGADRHWLKAHVDLAGIPAGRTHDHRPVRGANRLRLQLLDWHLNRSDIGFGDLWFRLNRPWHEFDNLGRLEILAWHIGRGSEFLHDLVRFVRRLNRFRDCRRPCGDELDRHEVRNQTPVGDISLKLCVLGHRRTHALGARAGRLAPATNAEEQHDTDDCYRNRDESRQCPDRTV